MRRHLLLACLLLVLLPARALASDTILWLSIGTGLTWYNEVDPDDLERLATAGSILSVTPTSGRQIAFDEKGFEVPALVELGLRLSPRVNIWGMYQRLPYVIDGPIPGLEAGGTPADPPDDTIRLRAPANVFGGGMDFRLGSGDGAMGSLILSLGIGQLNFEGNDEDVLTITNYTVAGRGLLYEARMMFEIDFARDLKFYPFVGFRYAKIEDTEAEYIRSPTRNPELPEYTIDYTGVTVGITARFKVWPFDQVDDEPSIFDE